MLDAPRLKSFLTKPRTPAPGFLARFTFQCFLLILCSALLPVAAVAADKIASVRVWPAQDYTRITIESAAPLEYQLLMLKNPERLALDLEGVNASAALQQLVGKIGIADPYVKAVRIGRFKPDVMRLVFDLKTEAKPQIFALKPIAEYGHRLVLDIYPAHPVDPLLALLMEEKSAAVSTTPATPAAAAVALSPTISPAPVVAPMVVMPPAVLPAPPDLSTTPLLAKANTATSTKPAKPSTQRLIVVVIDAGHGGEDPGAHGRGGTREKNVTLAIARKLKVMLDGQPNMRAVLTRDGDYFVPLGQRVKKAQAVHADLFVSIHADAFIKPHARGSSVFALSERGATSSAAKWLAKKENDADLIGGVNLDVPDPYLRMTLADLSFTAQINDSIKLGKAVLAELGDINTLHKDDVEQAGFAVLKAPDVPSILVETAFISNPDEEKRLKDEAYQEKMADAIMAGIKRYFSQNPPLSRGPFALNP